MVDCAKMLALHMAVLISFYRHFDFSALVYLLVPVAFQFAAVMVFFGGILTEQLKRAERLKSTAGGPAAVAPASTLRSVALLPVDYGIFCAIFLAFGSRDLFVTLYCVLLAAHVLFMVAFLVKWYRAPGRRRAGDGHSQGARPDGADPSESRRIREPVEYLAQQGARRVHGVGEIDHFHPDRREIPFELVALSPCPASRRP